MKKKRLLLLLMPFLLFVSCPDGEEREPPDPKYTLSGKTAAEYFEANQLHIGWNIGNALDGIDEQAWLPAGNNALINRNLMNGIKARGFNVVRIPVTWHLDRGAASRFSRIIGPAPDYKLNETRLERVAEVVDMAYEAGLTAIINIHHDGDPDKDGKIHYGSLQPNMYWLDVNGGAEVTGKLFKVWEQIASRFKDYGDWLIFEGFNEPRPAGNWGWNVSDAHLTTINEWNQAFTDAVRGAGGNNAGRFLVIQPITARGHFAIAGRVVPAAIQANPPLSVAFKLPADPAPGKQIVSVHWYYPEAFCLRGSSFYDRVWGADEHKAVLLTGGTANTADSASTGGVGFKDFKERYADNGIPVIVGECGVSNQEGGVSRTEAEKATAEANRLAFLTYFAEQAKAHGLTPILWDNGYNIRSGQTDEAFGLLTRSNGRPLGDKEGALIQAMIDAVSD